MAPMKNANTWAWLTISVVVAIVGSVHLSRKFGRTMQLAGTQGASALGGPSEESRDPASPVAVRAGQPTPGSTTQAGAAPAKAGGRATLVLPAEAAPLDSDARYGTTYRPGGAALGGFEAAVANGSIPASYKDVVGDFGSRYRPALPKPANGAALGFQIATERAALPSVGGDVNVLIAMRSSDTMPARAQLSAHLVLDVSGSMRGDALENAKSAATALVEKLQPADDFSLVTFSSEAKVLVPDGPIGPRRAMALEKIKSVVAGGGTNISAGLEASYGEARSKSIHPDAVKIVMLLSHGPATSGETSLPKLWALSEHAFQDGVQTSSFGLGTAFDVPLLSGIADRGAGGYYSLVDSTQIAGALGRELEARLLPTAQDVEVRVRLSPDVAPVKVFGSRGLCFFMPSFSRADRHAILLTVKVPAGVDERAIASVEVRYNDRLRKKNVTEEMPLKVKFATSDAESSKTAVPSVAATAQAFAAGETLLDAAQHIGAGHPRGTAAAVLGERAQLLKSASVELSEPRLNEDVVRVARLADAVDGAMPVSDPVPLAVLLRGAGYGYLR
jgi:Ca-activated chloride channel family protein